VFSYYYIICHELVSVWMIYVSVVTKECVLLLQNVFSYYRMCSLTTRMIYVSVVYMFVSLAVCISVVYMFVSLAVCKHMCVCVCVCVYIHVRRKEADEGNKK